MATMTVSSKYQLTLPMDMVRALGLKGGDKLDAELISGRIVLFPKPQSYTDYFVGSMKGFWGSQKEIDHYIAEQRGSWERREWREQVEDLLATDENARKIVSYLRHRPGRKDVLDRICKSTGEGTGTVQPKLDKLVELGAVRKIPAQKDTHGYDFEYRLVHEFAEA